MIDASVAIAAGGHLPPVVPAIQRTVTSIERLPGRKRRFVVSRANGLSQRQRSHVSERDMLDRLYTGIFIDTSLPLFGAIKLTCRELCHAWWVLCDLAWLLADEVGDHWLGTPDGLTTAAFTIKLSELVELVSMALDIDKARASTIVNFFLCDPGKTSKLFTESLWVTPLVPASGGRCHILLAALLMGTPRRRIEAWLECGGISDQRRLEGRGKPFEVHVRSVIGKELTKNPFIVEHATLPNVLERGDGGEETDLLARLGDTVIVGEIKCLLAPAEPMERFNYLNALDDAVEQARRKCNWVDANRADVLVKLGITDAARIAKIRLVPILILNQGYGFGLGLDGVAVTDLQFISMLLSSLPRPIARMAMSGHL